MSILVRPDSLKEATDLLAARDYTILCGGTDVFPALVDRRPPAAMLDVSGLAEIRGIAAQDGAIHIGGATTWSEIIAAPLPPALDALKAAAREVGSVQIQNRGTIAGNLCNASPAADGVPPLLALDADVELASSCGMRRLALADFILGNRHTARAPDEILSAVVVPEPHACARSAFLKLGARRYLVISIAMVAVVVDWAPDHTICDARIAVGSASLVAARLPALEARLRGQSIEADVARTISADELAPLTPIDDVRATAAYRMDAARELIGRALIQASEAHPHA
ncbi:MAG TPA: FAD binding domain-containing protein [Beijerinckiaceae bacterium]|nr:FAD binding domain-containing protein [Beijerinckiaceae bacterium]